MPVDEDLNLSQPLSADDLKQLEREAVIMEKAVAKMEKELEKAEKAKHKIGNTIKEINQLANHISPLGNIEGDFKDITHSMTGTPLEIEDGGLLPLGRQGMRSGEQKDRTPFGQTVSDQQKFNDEIKLRQVEINKELEELKRKQMEDRQKINDVRDAESKINNIEGDMLGLMNNPRGLALGKVKGMIGKSIYGIIAIMVLEFAEKIFNDIMREIKGMFQAGGIYDVRKLVKDEVHTIGSLDYILKMNEGMMYFSSNSSEVLRQGSWANANTRDLEYGHKQFLRMNNE